MEGNYFDESCTAAVAEALHTNTDTQLQQLGGFELEGYRQLLRVSPAQAGGLRTVRRNNFDLLREVNQVHIASKTDYAAALGGDEVCVSSSLLALMLLLSCCLCLYRTRTH